MTVVFPFVVLPIMYLPPMGPDRHGISVPFDWRQGFTDLVSRAPSFIQREQARKVEPLTDAATCCNGNSGVLLASAECGRAA